MSGTSLASLLTQLKKAYDAKSSTIAAKGKQPQMTTSSAPVSAILVQAKISLAQSGLLLPGTSTSQSKSDLQYAREILSYGALLSLQNGDVAGFERFLAQIKPFWDPSLHLDPSPLQAPLTGLSLLHLLSSNQIAGFHTLLEELVATHGHDQLLSDQNIKYALDLERWLMEGSYSKVWAARGTCPMPEYSLFLDRLVSTVRDEIASCGEKAYATLPLHDAAVLLFFQNREDLLQFASRRPGWQINPTTETISFEGAVGGEREESARIELPKERIVDSVLEYAKELETII